MRCHPPPRQRWTFLLNFSHTSSGGSVSAQFSVARPGSFETNLMFPMCQTLPRKALKPGAALADSIAYGVIAAIFNPYAVIKWNPLQGGV